MLHTRRARRPPPGLAPARGQRTARACRLELQRALSTRPPDPADPAAKRVKSWATRPPEKGTSGLAGPCAGRALEERAAA